MTAQPDDLLDAATCAAIARRIHRGLARPFPDPPPTDAYGLPMAIWARLCQIAAHRSEQRGSHAVSQPPD
jgi:hypothetical protein